MHNYHFCIIIPTRNRCNELFHTLRTVVSQTYPDLTILVSNNASSDETSKMVASFNDPRIVYIETEISLGMADHWEFVLNHAAGDYITYLGDDDGLCVNSIEQINDLLNLHPTDAVTWKKIEYCWPDFSISDYKNYLSIPQIYSLSKSDGMVSFLEAIKFRKGYNELPCIYNSFINLDLIKKIQKKTNGLFFRSTSPDIYSGFIVGYFIESYLYSSYPFSINGASRYSNGWLGVIPSINPERLYDFHKLSERSLFINSDKNLLGTSMICAAIIESLNAAKDVYGDIVNNDVNFYIERLTNEVQNLNEERYSLSFQYLSKYIEELGKTEEFQRILKRYPRRVRSFQPECYGYNPSSESLILDGGKFEIENIYDAAVLCNKILMPWSQFINNKCVINNEYCVKKDIGKKRREKILAFLSMKMHLNF